MIANQHNNILQILALLNIKVISKHNNVIWISPTNKLADAIEIKQTVGNAVTTVMSTSMHNHYLFWRA
ncbi:hypothetical protein [Shewanella halifaxensis]|uniref:hypothetical protein n=1 Tax=Shewanella halifaxensis TaxID=271098 RepID=UPI000D59F205|nr:hypothetical protein [Shewanella halifaxensis]